jgi:hydrogenase expression/formation protein HypE
MSKFSLDDLNKYVFPHFACDDPDVILGAVFGEDVALTRVGDDVLVSHLDPIVGAVNDIGWLAVHVACNDIATSGAPPRWVQLLVLVPKPEDTELLERIMGDVERAAREVGVSIIGGHTGYSAALSRPLVAVTALGTLSGRNPVLTGSAQPGDKILVSKGIALEGTAILASDFSKTALELGMTKDDLEKAKELFNQISVIPEAVLLGAQGATAMHDVTRGGILETLLEISRLSRVGLDIDYEKIPIPNIANRFSNAFKFDPLKMISSGTLVATIPPSKLSDARKALEEKNILYAVVGEVITGEGVNIRRNGEVNEYRGIHAEEDELARMWTVYKTDAEN